MSPINFFEVNCPEPVEGLVVLGLDSGWLAFEDSLVASGMTEEEVDFAMQFGHLKPVLFQIFEIPLHVG